MDITIDWFDLFAPIYFKYLFKQKRFNFLYGGRSSAKGSTAYGNMVIDLINNSNSISYVYVPLSGKSLDARSWKQIQKIINKMEISYTTNEIKHEITLQNGSKICVEGLDAINSKKSNEFFKGIDVENEDQTIYQVIFDEVASIREENLDRIRTKIKSFERFKPNFTFIFNPPKNKNHWLIDFMDEFDDEDALKIKTTVYDLPTEWFADDLYVQWKKEAEINPTRFSHEMLGDMVGDNGLAFPNASECLVDKNFYNNKNVVNRQVVIDAGVRDATTWAVFDLTVDGYIIINDVFYHSNRQSESELSFSDYAILFHDYMQKYQNVDRIYCDGLPLRNEIRKYGYKVINLTKKDRALQFSIPYNYFQDGKIKLISKDSNMIMYHQLNNAELQYVNINAKNVEVIKKVDNENIKEDKQIHTVDIVCYYFLKNYKLI